MLLCLAPCTTKSSLLHCVAAVVSIDIRGHVWYPGCGALILLHNTTTIWSSEPPLCAPPPCLLTTGTPPQVTHTPREHQPLPLDLMSTVLIRRSRTDSSFTHQPRTQCRVGHNLIHVTPATVNDQWVNCQFSVARVRNPVRALVKAPFFAC
jgi:hypothetical protein